MSTLSFFKKPTNQPDSTSEDKNLQDLAEKTKKLEAVRDQISRGWLEMERENSRLVAALDNLPFAFIFTDDHHNIVRSSTALNTILGTPPQEKEKFSTKWTIEEIQKHLKNFDLVGLLDKCLKDRAHIDPFDVHYGSKILRIYISPIDILKESLAVVGAVIVLEDVSQFTVLQKLQDEFFAVTSHELKAPLTAIRNNAELIVESKIRLDPQTKSLIENIYEDTNHLIRTVHDFLDLSALELDQIPINYEVVDVVPIIRFVINDLQNTARKKGLYLKTQNIPPLPQVKTDTNHLKQIVYNLIENSMKFTQNGGIIIDAQNLGDSVKITISDTGPGIDEQNQKLLFIKYHTRGEGWGIGLYLSRLLVEKMGGKIYLESSKLGIGSTFAFTIPIAKSS